MTCLETADVSGHFAHIMKVNLAQAIVMEYPQPEGKVIMTARWRVECEESENGWISILITFHEFISRPAFRVCTWYNTCINEWQ